MHDSCNHQARLPRAWKSRFAVRILPISSPGVGFMQRQHTPLQQPASVPSARRLRQTTPPNSSDIFPLHREQRPPRGIHWPHACRLEEPADSFKRPAVDPSSTVDCSCLLLISDEVLGMSLSFGVFCWFSSPGFFRLCSLSFGVFCRFSSPGFFWFCPLSVLSLPVSMCATEASCWS